MPNFAAKLRKSIRQISAKSSYPASAGRICTYHPNVPSHRISPILKDNPAEPPEIEILIAGEVLTMLF
jgi:hypothetical protein